MATLKETLNMFRYSLKEHIGSGDSAHLTADSEHNGFMSKEQFIKLNEGSGQRTAVPTGTDIFTLGAGRYEGVKLVNSPNEGLVDFDITIGFDGRKQIMLWESFSGRLWAYTWHTKSNGSEFGWTSITRKKTLWSGRANAIGTTLKLNDSLARFTFLNVELFNGSGGHVVCKVSTSGGNVTSVNLSKSGAPTVSFYEIGIWKVDVNNMVIRTNQKMYTNGAGLIVRDSAGVGSVVKIEGVIE